MGADRTLVGRRPARVRRWPRGASILGALALAACSREQVLVVFSPLEADLLDWAESAFESSHPSVDVRWVRLDPAGTLDRLQARPGDPEGDVWWGAPSWLLAEAAAQGHLATPSPSWAALVPESMRGVEGRWIGSFVDPLVLAFDREQVSRSRAPRTWDDLRRPSWTGEVVAPDPKTTVTGALLIGWRVATEADATGDAHAGFDWLRRFDASVAEYAEDEGRILLRLRRGLGSVAPLRLSTAERARGSEGALDYRVPEAGTPVLVEGIAGLAGARGEAAGAFIEWTGSAGASEAFAARFARMSARADAGSASSPAWLSAAAQDLRSVVIPGDSLARHLSGWIERWEEEVRGRAPRIY